MTPRIGEIVGVWQGDHPFAIAEVTSRDADSISLWVINGCWTMEYDLNTHVATIPAPSGTFTVGIYHLEYPYLPRKCGKSEYEEALWFLMEQGGHPRWYRQLRGWLHLKFLRGRRYLLRLKGAYGAFAAYWRGGKTPTSPKFADLEDDIPF